MPGRPSAPVTTTDQREPVYVAEDLLAGLCEFAADRDPDSVSVPLATTAAVDLDVDLDETARVFTHFYLPDAGRSVRAVFGVDLGTPAGETPGLFLSHPDGRLEISRRDDLREVVFVAVPDWEPAEVAAFDRRGRRRPLHVVSVAVPEESPP